MISRPDLESVAGKAFSRATIARSDAAGFVREGRMLMAELRFAASDELNAFGQELMTIAKTLK